MKKRLQGLVAGFLIGSVIFGGAAFAEQISKTAEIFYNNIKIYIDGGEITPKDAAGKVVEPFIYNGTTYLPVRAVANAFNQDVEWDGATQSVYIGKKNDTAPDNYLQKIQYVDYKEGHGNNGFAIINGTVTDYNNEIYKSGLLFFRYGYSGVIADDSDNAQLSISYPLNSQYQRLCGKIVLPKAYEIATWDKNDRPGASGTDVWFYGDGKLLYKATKVVASMPFSFDIKVSGVNLLEIKIGTEGHCHVALTDLALYK